MVANGFEGVPWMVGGGAKHSANVGRLVAYQATGGESGICSPTDLKVVPSSPTPNSQVHVGVGAVTLVNRYANAQSESYMAKATQVSDLTVGSTGSSARSDLIIARIKDPQYGAQAPASIADGPYAFPEIIPGVPANTTRFEQLNLAYPAYALARIDIPANTTAITGGYIKDLRRLVQPRGTFFSELQQVAAGQTMTNLNNSWMDFPTNIVNVEIPYWACDMVVRVVINSPMGFGPGPGNGNGNADLWLRVMARGLPALGDPVALWGHNAFAGQDVNDGLDHVAIVSGIFDVTGWRGETVPVKTQAIHVGAGLATGKVVLYQRHTVDFDIRFRERIL